MAASQRADALDLALDARPADASPVPRSQVFSVPSAWVRGSNDLRFDAEHYNPTLARAITLLRGSGMELRPLGEITERVFIPPRFRRVYVEKDHGVPFLQGSHLVQAEPADLKYVSRKAHKNLSQWVIREGWVLVTRSGTIGRGALARRQWDEWAASEHILRIVPGGTEAPAGYLLAFLRSFAGQAQLTSKVYGAVVDELTEDQMRAVLVPVAITPSQKRAVAKINAMVLESVARQEESVDLAGRALKSVDRLLMPSDASPEPRSKSFSVRSAWVRNSQGRRFDAEHYNPNLARATAVLDGSGMELRALGDVAARVFIPPRFKRVYVEREHGIPFLQGSHIVHAAPADLKFLSRKAHKSLEKWIIREGWVLATCSGTVGRTTLARKQWNQWAASQHILRIVPADGKLAPPGYLLAFLRSFAGQAQLTSHIYGAVVDELTEDQARAVLVPVAKTANQKRAVARVNAMMLDSVDRQEKVVKLAERALEGVDRLLES